MAYDYQGAINAGANPNDVVNYLAKTTGYNAQGAIKAGANQNDVLAYMAKLPSTPPQPAAPQDKGGIISDINNIGATRSQNIADDITAPMKAAQAGASPLEVGGKIALAGLNTAGDIAGGINDFIGEGVKAITPQPVLHALSSFAKMVLTNPNMNPHADSNNNPTQQIGQKWNEFATAYPDAAKALGSVFNIATLAGGAEAGQAAEPAITKASGEIATTAKGLSQNAAGQADIVANASKDAFVKELVAPQMGAKDLTNAIKTGRVTEATGFGSRDVTGALPNFSNIENAVKEVPGISPKNTLLENTNLIHDHIGTVAQDLTSQLAGKGAFTPEEFSAYMGQAKQSLAENPLIVGNAEQTASKILNKFTSLVKENGYDGQGLLKARQALDTWMTAQKGASVFDPATESAVSTALRTIRQGGNDFLAAKVPDVAVKDMLAKQTALYDAIDNIAPKAAKEGSTRWQQLIKAHPTAVKAAKYGALTVGGGEVLRHTGILP